MEDISKLVTELGLSGALSVLVFIAFFFLLKWVLATSAEQLRAMTEERKTWMTLQEGFHVQIKTQNEAFLVQLGNINESVKQNGEANKTFHGMAAEAHKYHREEHNEMIKALGRINGYTT